MPLVMNSTSKEVRVRAYGNWFTFNPGQIKSMEEKFANFLTTEERSSHGLVTLPEQLEDVEYRASPEGKVELEKAKEAGIKARCDFLKRIIHNETVSLQQDLDKSNIGADASSFASEAYVEAAEELLTYKQKQGEKAREREERIKQLQEKLKSIGD